MSGLKHGLISSFILYHTSSSCLFQVDYIPYSDEIADQIGCRPDIFQLFLKDPALGLLCFFGPCAPYQYRLMGPGAWDGAKKALGDLDENIVFPTKTRVVKKERPGHKMYFYFAIFIILIAFLVTLFRKYW